MVSLPVNVSLNFGQHIEPSDDKYAAKRQRYNDDNEFSILGSAECPIDLSSDDDVTAELIDKVRDHALTLTCLKTTCLIIWILNAESRSIRNVVIIFQPSF